MVKYLTDTYKDCKFSTEKTCPPNPYVEGYGSRIPTRYKVKVGSRTYRVYAICYSNVASHYVTVKGERLYLHDSDL